MKPIITTNTVKLFRITLLVQIFVAIWFVFSPDLLPASFVEVEMLNDRPLYETLDNIIVPLGHLQSFLYIALWWPTRTTSWAFLFVTGTIIGLCSFSGPSMLSAIDGMLDNIQIVALGAMLSILYLCGFFSISQKLIPNKKINSDHK